MQNFYILDEEQRDLYFAVIRELPDEFYNFEDSDVEILNRAINSGEKIEPDVLRRVWCASIFMRILKEIKVWHENNVYVNSGSCPKDIKKMELLEWINKKK